MNDIRALLRIAARRLELNSFIGKFHGAAIVFAAIALALMIVDRSTAAPFVPWLWVGPALAAVSLGIAAMLWVRRRPTESHVALVVDERLDLREKLSTALHCQGRDDAFAQTAVDDAVNVARDGRTRELLRRRFPVTAPGAWWVSPLIVLAAIMTSLLNPMNLFAREQQQTAEVTQAKLEADQSIQAIVKAIEEKPLLSKELALGEIAKEGTDAEALRRPEDFKRDALKKATDLSKKLDDLINGEKGKTADAVDKTLNQLKTPENGPAKELADAMAKGDFSKAQQALKDLMDKAQNGQLKDEDKEKVAEQLKDIAEQLDKLAQQQKQLENALKQAGLDPNLAQNPQALQQAIQNNQNLNQQQKQQLQQMAQAQQQAAKMCQGLGKACQQMAQACQGGQQGQQGQQQMAQAGQQMAQQLGQMEQLQQLLKEAQAAAGQCQGKCQGLGEGLSMQQSQSDNWSQKTGNQGGRGRAAGGNANLSPTPFATKKEKANVNTVEGDVIAKMLFEGEQVRGESKVKLVKVMEEAKKGYDEALTEDPVHVKYREAQQHYFGELEKLTKAIEAEKAKTEPAKTEPAKGAADGKTGQ